MMLAVVEAPTVVKAFEGFRAPFQAPNGPCKGFCEGHMSYCRSIFQNPQDMQHKD